VWEWELINEVKAIWLRDRTEITEQEYFDFYKTITKDHENPLGYTHFSAEGEIEFKSFCSFPATRPTTSSRTTKGSPRPSNFTCGGC
jgi:heat shock protein 90kDa beta